MSLLTAGKFLFGSIIRQSNWTIVLSFSMSYSTLKLDYILHSVITFIFKYIFFLCFLAYVLLGSNKDHMSPKSSSFGLFCCCIQHRRFQLVLFINQADLSYLIRTLQHITHSQVVWERLTIFWKKRERGENGLMAYFPNYVLTPVHVFSDSR